MVLSFLALPATALAGEAHMGDFAIDDPRVPYTEPALFFTASPGERNAITVVRDGPGFVLRDTGATVQAGAGCGAVDVHTVTCRPPSTMFPEPNTRIEIDAGDGDDRVTVPGGPQRFDERRTHVGGGAGDDRLAGAGSLDGGPGRDVLTGVETADTLTGDSGDDVLRGGGGDDRLDGGGGDDRIDGGAGEDVVQFTRRRGVRVDLAAGSARGHGGERDRLARIEDVNGGYGANVLLGDGRANVLVGGPGPDTVSGRGGDDTLRGNGADTLRGGAGNDTLRSYYRRDALFGGAGDDTLTATHTGARPVGRFRCGSGDDSVDGDPHGQLLTDCERVRLTFANTVSALPDLRRGGALRFTYRCFGAQVVGCDLTLALRLRSAPLARRHSSARARLRGTLVARPSRAVRRGDVLDVTASGAIATGEPTGLSFAGHWRARV